jgi:hypothetical protein
MERLADSYTIQAADVAAAYSGRGYNPRLGRWLTVSGIDNGSSRMTNLTLLDCAINVTTSGGHWRNGVIVRLFVVNDPSHPDLATPWFDAVVTKSGEINWQGRRPLAAGLFWRIIKGGVVDGDIVSIGVGYE